MYCPLGFTIRPKGLFWKLKQKSIDENNNKESLRNKADS